MQQLREKSDLPVIFLTALNQDETTHEAIKAGAHVYVVKPISLKQLVPIIETALARAADLSKLRTTGENLVTALRQSRDVSIAIGILIERHNISGEEAFERLRKHARSTRRRITEVAAGIIAGDTMLD
jgi:response regulator NasT